MVVIRIIHKTSTNKTRRVPREALVLRVACLEYRAEEQPLAKFLIAEDQDWVEEAMDQVFQNTLEAAASVMVREEERLEAYLLTNTDQGVA